MITMPARRLCICDVAVGLITGHRPHYYARVEALYLRRDEVAASCRRLPHHYARVEASYL
jgi:hypothetical protein